MKVLDFYADWCGPCQMLKPILEQVEKEHPEVEFEAINIDEQQEVAEKYGVMSIPTLIVMDGDEIKETLVGLKSKAEIEKAITA
ncbi:thioredoxin [Candidatus Saccharibacteria bacterium]|nr:thioredoxin [Candidatus Saccharibacteria bacterium]MBR0415693.1 thioredoxin [Candidatus Saccharibacteria bacterium]